MLYIEGNGIHSVNFIERVLICIYGILCIQNNYFYVKDIKQF